MRCLLFVLAETKISPKLYTPRVQRGKGETDDVAIGPPKGSGHPDNVRRNTPTQVAGPTEAAVCGSVVITRIQPTSKSFRVDRGNVVVLQASQTLEELCSSRQK
jgi:hypothetical protein